VGQGPSKGAGESGSEPSYTWVSNSPFMIRRVHFVMAKVVLPWKVACHCQVMIWQFLFYILQ